MQTGMTQEQNAKLILLCEGLARSFTWATCGRTQLRLGTAALAAL